MRLEAEIVRTKYEAETNKTKYEYDLQMAKSNAFSNFSASDIACRPTLPTFKDGEDIASYLTRFERVASLLGLSSDTYAVRLGSLLTGKAVSQWFSTFLTLLPLTAQR